MKKGMMVVLAAMLYFCGAVCAAEGRFVPPDGKTLVFVGHNNSSIRDYVKATGVAPAGVMFYTSVQRAEGLSETSKGGAGKSCGKYLLRDYPDTALQIGLYMVDTLDDVAVGKYNANIDRIGAWIKKSQRPVYLRIGYEFDFPQNRYAPAAYVKAYRYIVDRFRRNGVDNIAYVWHSYASNPSARLTDWYPGDEYVDWFGISCYRQSPEQMQPMIALAQEHRKPVMIGESTPAGIGTRDSAAWERWFRGYFDFIDRNDIKALCYVNTDWDAQPQFYSLNWKDSRLSSNKTVLQKWNEETRQEKYLHSSKDLFTQIGFTVRQ